MNMSEEERRRCIILGICGPGGGAAEATGSGNHELRRDALREHMQAHAQPGQTWGDGFCDDILSLIDESRNSGHSENPEQ
jgi:hypothetical protein